MKIHFSFGFVHEVPTCSFKATITRNEIQPDNSCDKIRNEYTQMVLFTHDVKKLKGSLNFVPYEGSFTLPLLMIGGLTVLDKDVVRSCEVPWRYVL